MQTNSWRIAKTIFLMRINEKALAKYTNESRFDFWCAGNLRNAISNKAISLSFASLTKTPATHLKLQCKEKKKTDRNKANPFANNLESFW